MIEEIALNELNPRLFIERQIASIAAEVGKGIALSALSGGVDSSTVTLLAHRALGPRLKTFFVDNGLMREGEPEGVIALFRRMGVPVRRVNAKRAFFFALRGKSDPEEKRHAITETFYKIVFGQLAKRCKATHLLHGTILTDVEETVAGVKRQHNILTQLGIDTQRAYGYRVIEPLVQLRKPAVRAVCRALGFPKEVYDRPPFPGPALTARVIGEATPARVELVRRATAIVETTLAPIKAFQCMAILHEDRVTGIRDGKRAFGNQIEIRCWESRDAVTAKPMRLPFPLLERLANQIVRQLPSVVSVTYNIVSKPPSTIEAV